MKAPPPGKRAIYINEARTSKYPTVLTGPSLALTKPISFSDSDASAVLFPHNDALKWVRSKQDGGHSKNCPSNGSVLKPNLTCRV